MKTIEALKNYIFAPYSLDKGETVTVPDAVGAKLVKIGFAKYVENDAQTPQEPPVLADDKTPAPDGKVAQRAARKRTAAKK